MPGVVTRVTAGPDGRLYLSSDDEGLTALEIGHTHGPHRVTLCGRADCGPVGLVTAIPGSMVVAFAAPPCCPQKSPRVVTVLDLATGEALFTLPFQDTVRGLRSSAAHLLVMLEQQAYLYTLRPEVQPVLVVETGPNPSGLGDLGLEPRHEEGGPPRQPCLAVLPSEKKGHAEFVRCPAAGEQGPPRLHRHEVCPGAALAALALSPCGQHAATADEQGLMIQVWDLRALHDGEVRPLCSYTRSNVRRNAVITELRFHPGSPWVSAVSDSSKGTVHVFRADGDAARGGQGHLISPAAAPGADAAAPDPVTHAPHSTVAMLRLGSDTQWLVAVATRDSRGLRAQLCCYILNDNQTGPPVLSRLGSPVGLCSLQSTAPAPGPAAGPAASAAAAGPAAAGPTAADPAAAPAAAWPPPVYE